MSGRLSFWAEKFKRAQTYLKANLRRARRDVRIDRLRYDTRLVTAFGVLLALMASSAFYLIYHAYRIDHLMQRAQLADQVHNSYYQLNGLIVELHGSLSERGSPTAERVNREGILVSALQPTVEKIRAFITKEIEVSGEAEVAELATLSRIESDVRTIVSEYSNVLTGNQDQRRERALLRIGGGADPNLAGSLRALIAEEMAEETKEVAEAHRLIAQSTSHARRTATAVGMISALFGLAALTILKRGLRQPLQHLVAGANAMASGNLSHRIPELGFDEFGQLARGMNKMAAEVAQKSSALLDVKIRLEEAISERTQELSVANTALQRADAQRRRFLADISHELRTPLTIIRGEAEVTLRGGEKLAEEYKNALRRIVEQAVHTATLVDDVLFLARREDGDTRFKQQSVAFAELVERVCDEARVLGDEKDVQVVLNLSVRNVVVVGDAGKIRQMILILLDNAMRYSQAHATVSVSVVQRLDKVSLIVADQGIGISKDELERVFERFYRGENAVSLHLEGTGLGLPMAKVIAEAHGGFVEITSDLGRGTSVAVTLPTVRKMKAVS